jgi:DNA-binding NarL/FixJ family response regulator
VQSSKRVLLADRGSESRLVLRLDLERDGRFAVVGEAGTGAEAVDLSAALLPDAVIIHLTADQPVDDAIEDIQARSPASKVIALTSVDTDRSGWRADARVDRRASVDTISSALASLCRV